MKELNQAVLEAATLAANEGAAKVAVILQQELGRPFSDTTHEELVSLLFQHLYHTVTQEWPGCELCGGDDHPEYACPNSR